jgi:hypothetical protein
LHGGGQDAQFVTVKDLHTASLLVLDPFMLLIITV